MFWLRWWREKQSNGISEDETRSAVERYRDTFTQLDERLAAGPWLMGERISIVDLSWYVNVQRLVRLGYPLSRHSQLADWFERLSARPAFRADAAHGGSRAAKLVFGLVCLKNRVTGAGMSRYI